MTPTKLAKALGRRTSTTAMLIRGLLNAGHMTAEVQPNDRRSFLLQLTPAGKSEWAEVRTPLLSAEAAIEHRFGATRLKALANEFEALASQFDHPPKQTDLAHRPGLYLSRALSEPSAREKEALRPEGGI